MSGPDSPHPIDRRAAYLAFALLVAAMLPGAPARGDEQTAAPASRLKELEGELKLREAERDQAAEHAAEVAREAEAIRTDMVSTAATIQENEESLSDLEVRLKDLDVEERAKAEALELRREQLNGTITALARLAFRPTEALIGQPTSPGDTVRSAILLRETMPRLEASAAQLKADLDSVATVRAAIAEQKRKIAATDERLTADHKRLAALYAKKAELREQAESERHDTEERLAALAIQAQDVRDLLARIEADREAARAARNAPPPPEAKPSAPPKEAQAAAIQPDPTLTAPRPFARAQGQMPFPARGRIAIRFGQAGEGGLPAKGITIETRPGAQVVAPYDGQVAFAGPFRGYGLLLIIEHSEGYHTLLAGMARIDSVVGQRLVAGEPVGVMDVSEERPLLYVELRHEGQPINPLPWLTARKSKVGE